jgi:L-alanine-DL-glutamate epimerase-like enolase superfamily enzyme
VKIVSAAAKLYRIPLPQPVSDAAHGLQTHFELVTVRLIDSDGVEGIGLTYTGGNGGLSIIGALKGGLLDTIQGEDADLIESLWRRGWNAMHYVGQGGAVVFAISAIDIALWDLKAKRAKLPLWRLLGGYRNEVRCYAGGIDLNFAVEELLEQSRKFRQRGLRAIKMKVGRRYLREDVERVAAMRLELGEGFPLMVDANMGWSRDEALRAAKALSEFGLVWLEEPIDPRDYRGHADVSREGPISIAAGENLRTISEFRQLIQTGKVRYVEPDVTNCGGVTGFSKIARLAEAFGAIVTSHGVHDLSIHLLAAFPNADYLEIHGYSLDEFLAHPLKIADGIASAPEIPGHGIEFIWKKLEQLM